MRILHTTKTLLCPSYPHRYDGNGRVPQVPLYDDGTILFIGTCEGESGVRDSWGVFVHSIGRADAEEVRRRVIDFNVRLVLTTVDPLDSRRHSLAPRAPPRRRARVTIGVLRV